MSMIKGLLAVLLILLSAQSWAVCTGTPVANSDIPVTLSGTSTIYCLTENITYNGTDAAFVVTGSGNTLDMDGYDVTLGTSAQTKWLSASSITGFTWTDTATVQGTLSIGDFHPGEGTDYPMVVTTEGNTGFDIGGASGFKMTFHCGYTGGNHCQLLNSSSSSCTGGPGNTCGLLVHPSDNTSNKMRNVTMTIELGGTVPGRASICRDGGCDMWTFEDNIVTINMANAIGKYSQVFQKVQDMVIDGNTITIPNTASYVYPFEIRDGDRTQIINNTINANHTHGRLISFENSTNGTVVDNNTITLNTSGGTVYVVRARQDVSGGGSMTGFTISGNTVTGDGCSGGSGNCFFVHFAPYEDDISGVIIRDNLVTGALQGIEVDRSGATGTLTTTDVFCNDIRVAGYAYDYFVKDLTTIDVDFSHNRMDNTGGNDARVEYDGSSHSVCVGPDETNAVWYASGTTDGAQAGSVSFTTTGSCGQAGATKECWLSAGASGGGGPEPEGGQTWPAFMLSF